jgi:hypothetical protein
MAKLTEEELRKIIQEELEDIDEGAFDRFLARSGGKLSRGLSGISNIGRGISQTFKGEEPTGRTDIEKVKKYTTVKNIIKQHDKKITPLLQDLVDDIAVFREDEESLAKVGALKDVKKRTYHLKGTFIKVLKDLEANLKNIKGQKE